MSKRESIINTVTDLVSDFLYYDRKEDEELGRGAIETAIRRGDITVDEIAEVFRRRLEDHMAGYSDACPDCGSAQDQKCSPSCPANQ